MSINYEEGTYWTLELFCDYDEGECDNYFTGYPIYGCPGPDEEEMEKAADAEGWTIDKKNQLAYCPDHSKNKNNRQINS